MRERYDPDQFPAEEEEDDVDDPSDDEYEPHPRRP
jgi:hypothetical protein